MSVADSRVDLGDAVNDTASVTLLVEAVDALTAFAGIASRSNHSLVAVVSSMCDVLLHRFGVQRFRAAQPSAARSTGGVACNTRGSTVAVIQICWLRPTRCRTHDRRALAEGAIDIEVLVIAQHVVAAARKLVRDALRASTRWLLLALRLYQRRMGS